MRQSVRDAWIGFTEDLEGGVAYPYADIRNLITVAYGNLIDPVSLAMGLPFVDAATGLPATPAQIAAGWNAVKSDPAAARKGHTYARGLTTLRLTAQGMADLALQKLADNDAAMRLRFGGWDAFPACAQMALLSLCWACGAAFNFPKLAEAVRAQDWDACSVHIGMNEYTPEGLRNAGLVPRNARNRLLMSNAERVRGFKLDPDTLNWTTPLDVSDVDTQPEFAVEPENTASRPTSVPPSPTQHVDPSAILRPREWLAEDDPDDAA